MPTVFLVDATYELFRAWFAVPSRKAPDGREIGATAGLLSTLVKMLRDEGATHAACATDHVVRSFRNDLYAGYKTEEGVPSDLLDQFPLAEEAMRALGLVVWPMIEFEADDAIATGAMKYAGEDAKICIASVDKDLAQCVRGDRVILVDRRKKITIDEDGVRAKWGVSPGSIADWLALVGDAADGYPGLPGWGARSASAVLAVYESIEAIPDDAASWTVKVRGADRLASTLAERREEAMLYKTLATLRTDVPLTESQDDLAWQGARPELRDFCDRLGIKGFLDRVPRWA